jgi:hypothetical protein
LLSCLGWQWCIIGFSQYLDLLVLPCHLFAQDVELIAKVPIKEAVELFLKYRYNLLEGFDLVAVTASFEIGLYVDVVEVHGAGGGEHLRSPIVQRRLGKVDVASRRLSHLISSSIETADAFHCR